MQQFNRFGPTSVFISLKPVALPPGLLRLATRPVWMGSEAIPKTIGIVAIAAFAAIAACVLPLRGDHGYSALNQIGR
jgi:hypothetical protein